MSFEHNNNKLKIPSDQVIRAGINDKQTMEVHDRLKAAGSPAGKKKRQNSPE